MNCQFPDEYYDIVVIRGAIEHFSQENQLLIFNKVWKTLKTGGFFCGDTVANPNPNSSVLLEHHEHEWKDETQMREELELVFNVVETYTVSSRSRISLFWRCLKI